jgi:hypothetical protein
MIVCGHCRTASVVQRSGLELAGLVAPLVELGSRLSVGQNVRVRGRHWVVLGRVRYAYDDGVWDEWTLASTEGTHAWLHEDEGDLTLFTRREEQRDPSFTAPEVRAGSTTRLGGRDVFVSERGSGRVEGAEGQVFAKLVPDTSFFYVDGLADGATVSFVAAGDTLTWLFGEPLQAEELELA